MSKITIHLPELLHKSACEMAQKKNISINQLITLALAEKIAEVEPPAYDRLDEE